SCWNGMCHASYCRVASIDPPGKYAQRFAENAIDLSVVCYLTEEDLKELGVPLGHGRKMLHAIAELSAAAAVKGSAASEPLLRDGSQSGAGFSFLRTDTGIGCG